MPSWCLSGRPRCLDPNSEGPQKMNTIWGLMVDGDEMCVKLGESGGRINLDSVLAD